MTARKPPKVSWQTWVDKQIVDGRADGAFEDLPGYGKPLPGLDRGRDELWWVRQKLQRENVEFLPLALRVAKQREDALVRARNAVTEAEVRGILDEVNRVIRYVNSHVIEGPPSSSVVIDVDAEIERWRARNRPPASSAADSAPIGAIRAERERRRWWRRRRPPQVGS